MSARKQQTAARSFLLELAIYSVLVTAYFLLVLHLVGGGIKGIYDHDRRLYAVLALALMVTQGIGLEFLTSWLLKLVSPNRR